MAEENVQDLSLEKVQEFIKGQVQTFAQESFQRYEEEGRTKQQQQQSGMTPQQEAQENLRQTLSPFIDPKMNAVQLVAADTSDKVDFYLNYRQYADIAPEVEVMFNELKGQGRAIPRADVAKYIMGNMQDKDPERFDKIVGERKKAQLDRVNSATDMGQGALDKAKNDPVWSQVRLPNGDFGMKLEDLERALDGVAF